MCSILKNLHESIKNEFKYSIKKCPKYLEAYCKGERKMVNMYMKRCPTSLITQEIKLKTQ